MIPTTNGRPGETGDAGLSCKLLCDVDVATQGQQEVVTLDPKPVLLHNSVRIGMPVMCARFACSHTAAVGHCGSRTGIAHRSTFRRKLSCTH